jgi:hypothetical protein
LGLRFADGSVKHDSSRTAPKARFNRLEQLFVEHDIGGGFYAVVVGSKAEAVLWRSTRRLHKIHWVGMNLNSLLAKAEQFIRVAAPEIFRCEA